MVHVRQQFAHRPRRMPYIYTQYKICLIFFLRGWSSVPPGSGAVGAGPGAARVPVLEAWGSALHVLPHPAPEEAVD